MLRGRTTVARPTNPGMYVDGARATNTCVLETLNVSDVHRVEIYPIGIAQRGAYEAQAGGLILSWCSCAPAAEPRRHRKRGTRRSPGARIGAGASSCGFTGRARPPPVRAVPGRRRVAWHERSRVTAPGRGRPRRLDRLRDMRWGTEPRRWYAGGKPVAADGDGADVL